MSLNISPGDGALVPGGRIVATTGADDDATVDDDVSVDDGASVVFMDSLLSHIVGSTVFNGYNKGVVVTGHGV